MYQIIFHPEAYREFFDSVVWYEEQRKNLGEKFILAVNDIISQVQLTPKIFPVGKRKLREAPLPLFPFNIVYKENDKSKSIYILAIFHTSRNPKLKYRRSKMS